jgi:hypothetical protein
MMGHMGENAVRSYLNHHGYKVTGELRNCVSFMKWRAQNKPVYPERRKITYGFE